MKSNEVLEKLDEVVPNPVCELIYNKDYELLIATVLAAQSTYKRVNEVTKVLFSKYDIFSLAKESAKKPITIILHTALTTTVPYMIFSVLPASLLLFPVLLSATGGVATERTHRRSTKR